jgi:hypothetical protein
MRAHSSVAAISLLVMCNACSDPSGVSSPDSVAVEPAESSVMITNEGSATITFQVMDAAFAALANWAPCVHPDCPSIRPGETSTIAADSIHGWAESDEIIVSWWHVYRTPVGEYIRGPIYAKRVRY